jgi:hypothetical protein
MQFDNCQSLREIGGLVSLFFENTSVITMPIIMRKTPE